MLCEVARPRSALPSSYVLVARWTPSAYSSCALGRRCERDSDSATEYCGAKSQMAAADSDVPDRLLREAPPDGEMRCQSWRAPTSKRQSFSWYSSSTNRPLDRVLLRGRKASSPSARKSL
ncbi:hypothetical protein G6F57_022942 [Rhizopus arrhizus]|nr:hypothetical protein G6F57_022942 [Rhizopus arrhizus]